MVKVVHISNILVNLVTLKQYIDTMKNLKYHAEITNVSIVPLYPFCIALLLLKVTQSSHIIAWQLILDFVMLIWIKLGITSVRLKPVLM